MPPLLQTSDEHYARMDAIVKGTDKESLKTPKVMPPGTLNLFRGSQCLHRVNRNTGTRNRMVAILCFAKEEGVKNSPQVQELFWGRSTE